MAEPVVRRTAVRFLLPGSFNPITMAHLRMVELAKDFVARDQRLEFESAVISPVGDSYGEKKNLQPANLRVEMCRQAIVDEMRDWLSVDDWESQQSSWIKTLDALTRQQSLAAQLHRHKYHPHDDDDDGHGVDVRSEKTVPHVMLLCGADLIESFARPGLWDKDHILRIIREFGILVISRKGSEKYRDHVPDPSSGKDDAEERDGGIESPLSPCAGIHHMEEWIPNEISSTKVRFGIKNGLSVRHVIPDPVLRFIRERKLYETEPM